MNNFFIFLDHKYIMNNFFDKTFVLTAPGFQERQIHMNNEMQKLQTDFEFHYGVNGEELEIPFRKKYPNFVHRGEIGCALTHYSCWEKALNSGCNSVLILEDDVTVSRNAEEIISEIMNNVPQDWTIIHFGVFTVRNLVQRKRCNDFVSYGRLSGESEGAWAYSLSRKGLQYLVDTFKKDKDKRAADGMTNWLSGQWDYDNWHKLGRAYVALRQAFTHWGPPSENGRIHEEDKKELKKELKNKLLL